MDCVFCQIASGEIAADILHQDTELVAFRDIYPQAPKHIIVIPKSHIASVEDLAHQHRDLIGRLILLARELAGREGMSASGYRLVINCGPDGGQLIPHLHLHLLGGHKLDGRLG